MSGTPSSLTPTQLRAYLAFTEVSALLRPSVEQQLKDAAGCRTCSSSCWPDSATPPTATCG